MKWISLIVGVALVVGFLTGWLEPIAQLIAAVIVAFGQWFGGILADLFMSAASK